MRTVFYKTCCLLMLLSAALVVHAQDRKTENALLWKITGPTLSRPSYVFGTIHLHDRRVFNFNDSLYKFLESADGFAMELHPDSMTFTKQEESAGFMETFVDAYLFEIAKGHGKEIIGLESPAEQEKVLTQLWSNVNVNAMMKGVKRGTSLSEHLTALYVREDLNGIMKLLSAMPKKTAEKFFIKRNYAMLGKMENIIMEKSFLFAVGAGHLAGRKGLIALLRQRGYTVEPVYAKGRTHASKYSRLLTWSY